MFKKRPAHIVCFFIFFITGFCAVAQLPDRDLRPPVAVDGQGRPVRQDSSNLQLEHRDPLEDSITINFHYFDSTKILKLDSSINDFYTRYPVPYYYYDLGNFGTAAKSIFFSPYMQAGWDAGFHSYDVYKFRVEDTRLFTTTRPYTELAYLLGSKSEQLIDVTHTQNRRRNFNFGIQYRLINAPGAFKNQNTNNSNIRVDISYNGKNRRYSNNFIFISNKMHSGENGGVQSPKEITGLDFNDPFAVPVRIGNTTSATRNPFATAINTGTLYDEQILLLRQNFDIGQKDSLVTDSTVYKLFYPRLRLQYTVEYRKESYVYQDYFAQDSLYLRYYNYYPQNKNIYFKDGWQILTNTFSLLSYPQKNNLNQFLKVSAGYEIVSGGYNPYLNKYNNIYFEGEYRNRTRNQKWDILASGKLYTSGEFIGNYQAYISFERLINRNRDALKLGFQNVNRSPSEIFKGNTAFPVFTGSSFGNENISRAFATIALNSLNLLLTGEYFIVGNYIYFNDFFAAQQQTGLLNVLHAGLEKKIKLARHWNWYIDADLQKTTAKAPVNLPFIFTRNRFAFEGNFFKNLWISTGFEMRYYTKYMADNYSPLNGQFFLQDTFSTIGNRPNVNVFLNMRIKGFKGFARLENLNTLNPDDKYRFTKNNFAQPNYPQRGFWIRVGVWWSFVN